MSPDLPPEPTPSPEGALASPQREGSAEPLESVVQGHAPPKWQEDIPPSDQEELNKFGLSTGLHVLVADIRMSTSLMKEAVRPANHVAILDNFVSFSRDRALQNHGWYDKFTGDGFIAYWVYGREDIERHLIDVLTYARDVLSNFDQVIRAFRQNSHNFPSGVGIALGLASGPCSLVRVGGSLTAVGAPMVGARRMVDSCGPGRLLCNVFLGEVLESSSQLQDAARFKVQRAKVDTKEYPEGQEAYWITFDDLASKE